MTSVGQKTQILSFPSDVGVLVQCLPVVVLPGLANTSKPEAARPHSGVGRVQTLCFHSCGMICFYFLGTQISCFSPSSFSWRQAAFVDSYCWAAVQQKRSLHGDSGNLPLWLHKVTGTFSDFTCLCIDVGPEAQNSCASPRHTDTYYQLGL